jgi:glycosyltransferase involved in cell wall biosynthesis
VQVFHKENGGVSRARNLGLDKAKGKWIAFIDSDDWMGNTYLEHLLEGDEDVELRIMGLMAQKHNQQWKKHATHKKIFLTDDFWRFYKLYLMHPCVIAGPVVKLFLLSVINAAHIRFKPYLSSWEDFVFNLQYLKQIKSISVKNYAEYYYRYTENSLSKNASIDNYEKSYIHIKKAILPLINNKRSNDIINNYLNYRLLSLHISRIKHLYLYLYLCQNLKAKDRQEYLSNISIDLNESNKKNIISFYLSVAKVRGYLIPCIVFLDYVPIFVADTVFLFLFWLKRKTKEYF